MICSALVLLWGSGNVNASLRIIWLDWTFVLASSQLFSTRFPLAPFSIHHFCSTICTGKLSTEIFSVEGVYDNNGHFLADGLLLRTYCLKPCILTCFWGCKVTALQRCLQAHRQGVRLSTPQHLLDMLSSQYHFCQSFQYPL